MAEDGYRVFHIKIPLHPSLAVVFKNSLKSISYTKRSRFWGTTYFLGCEV